MNGGLVVARLRGMAGHNDDVLPQPRALEDDDDDEPGRHHLDTEGLRQKPAMHPNLTSVTPAL